MLNEEQKDTVREWAEAGATLSEIHQRITEELGVTMTYFDARLLVADLKLSLDKPEPEPEETEDETDETAELPAPQEEPEPETSGEVQVQLDSLAQPNAMASGKATFANGKRASWYIDQMGRLGLDPDDENFRPSQEEVMAFQSELQATLKREGI